jgi:hypothetical protein
VTAEVWLAILFVALAWAGTIFVARRFGVGYGARSVRCPHEDRRATISTAWKVRTGTHIADRDVLQCSLLPEGEPVTCDKSCLAQL